MTLSVCRACSAKFAVGLARCPHCLSTDFAEQGSMPKITREGGPSNASAPEEEPWPGSNSSPSAEKQPTSDEPQTTSRPRLAPTTANPSKKGRKAGSTARTTGGSGGADN